MLLSVMLHLVLHTSTLFLSLLAPPPHPHAELTVAEVCGSAHAGLPVSQPHSGGERQREREVFSLEITKRCHNNAYCKSSNNSRAFFTSSGVRTLSSVIVKLYLKCIKINSLLYVNGFSHLLPSVSK